MDWGLYSRQATIYGETDHERALNMAKEDFERDAVLSPSYCPNATRNGKPQRFIIDRTESTYKNKVIAFPGEDLCVGDIVSFRGARLIIQECRTLNELQKVGTGWLCNLELKFQNGSSDIISRWCVLDSGVYSTTMAGDGSLQETDKQFKIYLPYDEDTKKLYVDKRIAVDVRYDHLGHQILEVYKITGMNRVARSYGAGGHLLILEVRSDEYSASRDNLDLMVCDYIATTGDTQAESLMIQGRDTVPLNSHRKYTVRTKDGGSVQGSSDWSYSPIIDGVSLYVDEDSAVLEVGDATDAVGTIIDLTFSCGESGSVTKRIEVVA